MTAVASNVLVGVTGGVFFAPVGTALPTSPSAVLNAGFLDVGFLTEDAITQSIGDSTTEIKAWQNGEVVRRIQTDHSAQFKFGMEETNANSLAAYYGGNYAAGVAQIKAGVMPRKSWVLHIDDDTNDVRIVIPDGQIVERGDVMYKNADAIAYPVTIECYPDAAGVKAYIYYATSAVSA